MNVFVFSNIWSDERLADMQWLASKDGVELSWDNESHDTWSIRRAGTLLSTSGAGHYFDSTPATRATNYTITHEGQVEVDLGDGTTTSATKPTTYVMNLPAYDERSIGLPIDDVGAS